MSKGSDAGVGAGKKRHILIWPLACHSFAHCPKDSKLRPKSVNCDSRDATVSEAEMACKARHRHLKTPLPSFDFGPNPRFSARLYIRANRDGLCLNRQPHQMGSDLAFKSSAAQPDRCLSF